jgi:predicted AAA+ superfamily ATPase
VVASGRDRALEAQPQTRRRRLWFASYLATLTGRDVADISPTLSTERLMALLRLLAANQAGETVITRLAADIGLAPSSFRTYLDAAKALFLITSLPPWTPNLTKQVTGRRKTMIADSGLAAHLVGLTEDKLAQPNALAGVGGFLEAFVVGELRKQQGWTDEPFELFHFRDRQHREVDIVIEYDDGAAFLIEVKSSQTHRPEFTRTIRYLQERLPDRVIGGAVLQPVQAAFNHGRGVWSLPISTLWE